MQDNRSANDRVRAGELQLCRDDLREDLTVDWREDNVAKIALVRSRVIETSVKRVRRVPVWASSLASLIVLNRFNQSAVYNHNKKKDIYSYSQLDSGSLIGYRTSGRGIRAHG